MSSTDTGKVVPVFYTGRLSLDSRERHENPSPSRCPLFTTTLSRSPHDAPEFDSQSFSMTIVENNLFRPLGWQPTRPVEPYRLLGTILARDANTPPEAIIKSSTGHQTYIVTLGSNLDVDTQVVDIQSKQVTLSTQGQHRTLILPIGF